MAPLTAAGTGALPPRPADAAPVEAAPAGLGLSVPPPHAAMRAAAATATGARRSRRLRDGRVRRSVCTETAPSEGDCVRCVVVDRPSPAGRRVAVVLRCGLLVVQGAEDVQPG